MTADPTAVLRWCDRCGDALDGRPHERCAAARTLEPPRFCPACRRRLRVQVLPAGWTAECVEHGRTRSATPDRAGAERAGAERAGHSEAGRPPSGDAHL